MKLNLRESADKVEFAFLAAGAVFKDADGDICLKLNEPTNDDENAVCLDSGELYVIDDCADVIEVSGAFVEGA